MAHEPGDRVLEIGTLHVNKANGAMVVEVSTGVVAKDGHADLKAQNVTVPWNEGIALAYGRLVAELNKHLTASENPTDAPLKTAAVYQRPVPPPVEDAKPEA